MGNGTHRVALTIDAELPGRVHAERETAGRIFATLTARNVPTTWFVQGRWARLDPDVLHAVADSSVGHVIGNHSESHVPMTRLTDNGVDREVLDAEASIADVIGRTPTPYFRCPNLIIDGRVARALERLGYVHVGADVLSADWEPAVSPVELVRRVVDGVRSREGRYGSSVVLLHSWPRTTYQALPRIIEELSLRGAEFVTVDKL